MITEAAAPQEHSLKQLIDDTIRSKFVDTRRLDPLAKGVNRMHQAVYRMTKGRVGGKMKGVDLVMLTTVGRKSGQRRTAMVGAPIVSDTMVVVLASYAAGNRNPQWYFNLLENPEVELVVRGARRKMVAREAKGEERLELWRRAVAQGAPLDTYQAKTERTIPVVVLEPAG